jgi:hypothetical protein
MSCGVQSAQAGASIGEHHSEGCHTSFIDSNARSAVMRGPLVSVAPIREEAIRRSDHQPG